MAAIDDLEKVKIVVDGVEVEIVGGSFKGVPFFVDEYVGDGFGRNVVSKMVPFSSNFVSEDLGGKIPEHKITLFFVGDECKQSRDNFTAKCNEEGAGEFIHPFYGKFRAECVGLTVRGSKSGVNYCTAEATFRPASSGEGAAVLRDLSGATRSAARDFQNASVDKFDTKFTIVGKDSSLIDGAVAATQKAMDVVLSARKILSTANDFVSAVGAIKQNVKVMLMAPADFSSRVQNIITASAEMFGIDSNENESLDEYLRMVENLDVSQDVQTPAGQINSFIINIAASQLVSSLVNARFDNVDEAADFQERISAAFERLLSSTFDVQDYLALSGVESTALTYLRNSMENIAVVLEKDIPYSQNVLSLCFDTYGNLDKVDDILSRNGFVQGLFILPGKVKVLSK